MVSSLLDPARAATTTLAQANYSAYATDFVPKQIALRALLDAAGLNPAVFGAYEAYSGQLYHLYRTTSGASLIAAAGVVKGHWMSASRLGAGSEALLKSIAQTVYNIVLP
jgi:hypothetical protein